MTLPRRLGAALILACVALPACGGGDKPKDSAADPRRTTAVAPANRDPEPSEDVKAVIDRVRGAVTAGSCDPVKGLMHSFYGTISDAACSSVLAQLGGFEDPHGKAFGTGMAIDFRAGKASRLMALVLDADRTYKLDFIVDSPGGGGDDKAPTAATASAAAAVAALQSGDCDAFLRNADRRLGIGLGSDQEVCANVSDSLLRRELVQDTSIRPRLLGGTGTVAFFKLRTAPGRYYTLVALARPVAGATRWGIVNALSA
ncbi:MAG: hypothetical protein ACR2NH_05985 [Solirubrobacteraceae bacterium]